MEFRKRSEKEKERKFDNIMCHARGFVVGLKITTDGVELSEYETKGAGVSVLIFGKGLITDCRDQ